VRMDPVLMGFDNPEGAELTGYLHSCCGSCVCELANVLRLGTVLPRQDLSGTGVTVGS
jgi:hypothetical protein